MFDIFPRLQFGLTHRGGAAGFHALSHRKCEEETTLSQRQARIFCSSSIFRLLFPPTFLPWFATPSRFRPHARAADEATAALNSCHSIFKHLLIKLQFWQFRILHLLLYTYMRGNFVSNYVEDKSLFNILKTEEYDHDESHSMTILFHTWFDRQQRISVILTYYVSFRNRLGTVDSLMTMQITAIRKTFQNFVNLCKVWHSACSTDVQYVMTWLSKICFHFTSFQNCLP